jgi:hypothetical protein
MRLHLATHKKSILLPIIVIIYLFILLLNDAEGSIDCVTWNDPMISGSWIGKDAEESIRGLIWDAILEFSLLGGGKSRIISVRTVVATTVSRTGLLPSTSEALPLEPVC